MNTRKHFLSIQNRGLMLNKSKLLKTVLEEQKSRLFFGHNLGLKSMNGTTSAFHIIKKVQILLWISMERQLIIN